jgi:hypothetical protein
MKLKVVLLTLLGLVLLAVGAALIAPRLLVQAATEKPKDVGEMVTAPPPAESLDIRQQLAAQIEQPASRGELSAPERSFADTPDTAPGSTYSQSMPTPAESDAASDPHTEPLHSPPASTPARAAPVTGGKRPFALELSESQLASMVYTGIYQGSDPRYRPAIQGVSMQLAGGSGKLTVALLPRHLPDDMLRNFPGVTRDSPTIYVGGEVGLAAEGGRLVPSIRNISFGNLKLPLPMIRSVAKYQILQYARQMTQLESGQEAVFDEVTVDGGMLRLRGYVE